MGLVHIYTGNGKGKTTAALGLSMRAWGRGFRVLFVQFLKGSMTGEIKAVEKLKPGFELYRGTEITKFVWNMNEVEFKNAKALQNDVFLYAVGEIKSGSWDLVVLDEVMAAITTGMLNVTEVAELIRNKPTDIELVLTGRNAPDELIELSDYVSVIEAKKHPMDKGIKARKGIEE